MISKNSPLSNETTSPDCQGQDQIDKDKPSPSKYPLPQDSLGTPALNQPVQQDHQGGARTWIQDNFKSARPQEASILQINGTNQEEAKKPSHHELKEEYDTRWQNNLKVEEEAEDAEPVASVDIDLAQIGSSTPLIVFWKIFQEKHTAKEFLKVAKRLKSVSCESLKDKEMFEGNVTLVKLEESPHLIKCAITVKFFWDKYKTIKDYIQKNEKNGLISWTIKEKKIKFFDLMRDNLQNLKGSLKKENILKLKTKSQTKTLMDPEIEESYKRYVAGHSRLNDEQIAAIRNCLLTTDYNLVLGLPGTGKTEVIAILLKVMIESKKKVLITALTHSAIDNILKRFLEEFPEDREKIARFGSEDKIDPEIVDLKVDNKSPIKGKKLSPEKEDMFEPKMIFAVTCHGVTTKLLDGRNFATCIVDEASQIVEPLIIGPLLKAGHFVLFGDHNQLSPLVKSDKAKEGGMDISLFEKLAEAQKDSVSELRIQYRMNENIMKFSNQIIYEGRMKCGNEQVKTGQIKIDLKKSKSEWIKDILNPNRHVVFLDLGEVRKLYQEDSMNLNCSLTCFVSRELISHGMKEKDIGIISPLRDDLDIVDTSLEDLKSLNRYTIDTCQGINKSCIIMNLSLDTNRTGSLLSSKKRMNVAFTRAKHKLIIIGSFNELKKMEGIGRFIQMLDQKDQREEFDYKMLQEAKIVKSINETSTQNTSQ